MERKRIITKINSRTECPYEIGKEVWHLASNSGTENAHILEIQWGSECIEEDIERRDYMKVFVGYDTREDIAYQVCKHSH